MDTLLEHFATAFAAHAAFDGVKAALRLVANRHPELEKAAEEAAASKDALKIEQAFESAVGVIIAEAKAGTISVDGATLTALRGIKFDHQHGTVTIGNATVSAAVLVTGGSADATGETTIGGNTTLASQGTKIEVGSGASIKMTGGASIKQT
jgi:hypothetical protein